jgi:hypothetical protein
LSGHWWDAHAWQTEEWDILLGGASRGLYRISLNSAAIPNDTPHSTPENWLIEGCYDAVQWPLPPAPPPPKPPS